MPDPSNIFAYKRVAGTDPAAQTELSDAVPPGKTWLLLSYSVSLVQGLTQTPQPILIIDDGTNGNSIFEEFGATNAMTASTTCRFNWAPGLPLTAVGGSGANCKAAAPLPFGLYLPSGYRIRTSTSGIGANSDYGAPSIYVVEFG